MNQILALAESSLAALKAYRASHYTRDEHAASALQSLKQIVAPLPQQPLPSPAQPQTQSVQVQALPMPQVRRSPRLKQSRRASFTHK
jgi:hypothetical protein